jgi:hypothetical protein
MEIAPKRTFEALAMHRQNHRPHSVRDWNDIWYRSVVSFSPGNRERADGLLLACTQSGASVWYAAIAHDHWKTCEAKRKRVLDAAGGRRRLSAWQHRMTVRRMTHPSGGSVNCARTPPKVRNGR